MTQVVHPRGSPKSDVCVLLNVGSAIEQSVV